jgi:hypothetical protein
MDSVRELLSPRCWELLAKIGILENDRYSSLPLSRYIVSIPYCIPVKHVILAERPYATDIFPYIGSAMAYNSDLDMDTTPIVHFLAMDISNGSDLDYDTCRNWFRDGWKYLNSGVLLLNVCTTYSFMDNRSEKERVAMEEFLRDIISVSLMLSDDKIHVYALGNPARHSAGRIKSSIAGNKNRVVIHNCKNPAGFKHKIGDRMSPNFTMGFKSITRLFTTLIRSTSKSNSTLTERDYIKMAEGDPDYNKLKARTVSSHDVFKDLAAYFKANTGKTIDRNEELFERAAEEMKQLTLALSAAKVKLLFAHISEPSGTAKPAYFSQRTNYNNTNYSRGSSSKASVAATPAKKQTIGFADEETPAENTVAESIESSKGISDDTTPKVMTPQTPTPAKIPYAASAAGQSNTTRRTVSIGFADEDSDDNHADNIIPEHQSVSGKNNTDFNVVISEDELADLSLVSDFIDPSNEDYVVEPAILEFIQESIRTKRAVSDVSKEVLTVIRNTHSDKSQRSISNALGYDDEIVDVPSPIMQWVMHNLVKS